MKLKTLLLAVMALAASVASAQDGGIKGHVVSRIGREAVENISVTVDGLGVNVKTDNKGNFVLKGLPQGDHKLVLTGPDFETLELMVKVGQSVKDLNTVVVVPASTDNGVDDSVFAELDNDSSSSDTQALPTSLSSSKDIFNNIASFKFSEIRFNVRGYDSQYQDVYLNGIRFNDALTGFGPWSLWSGMNDATRNQENVAGNKIADFGVGGIGGMTNINARASQMRKGFRASVSNGSNMYRFRAIVSYASGALDNGWSYAFSFGTRQGGNGWVDGVYYNSYGYFASVEKLFGTKHRLALTVLGTPQERGAQQASTEEAYNLYGSHFYNPNVGYQDGKLRNSRVRNSHEPIVMLNYTFDISEKTRLNAATSFRFGKNGYSALTWKDGADPRPDYYRFLPSNYLNQITPGINGIFQETSASEIESLYQAAFDAALRWNGRINYDYMYNANRRQDTTVDFREGYRSNYMIEERHTDQKDFNFTANIAHEFNRNHRLIVGVNARINKTEYYDQVKDLLGGDYWLDIDKFAERDMGSNVISYQNDLDYYYQTGHAKAVEVGDKLSYDYYANVRLAQLWAQYNLAYGGFNMTLAAEGGYSSMWREGLMRKGLFAEWDPITGGSLGNSEKLNYFTYKAKANFAYRFNNAHLLEINATAMQNAPSFQNAFVSPRTRNQLNAGITTEKIYSAELVYTLNLPFMKARLSGFYTKMMDGSKVISFYDDTQSSFTNFAMSGIDKQYYGVELGLDIPIYQGLSLRGAISWGDYKYTSNPYFIQTVDNSAEIKLQDNVYWKDMKVEGSPQFAINAGLNYRGPKGWYASVDFNYYDKRYLSMNPAYRTENAVKSYINVLNNDNATDEAKIWALGNYFGLQEQENLGSVYTLSASLSKNWSIYRKYTIGFSAEVKNLLNNKGIKTGGYEQMRLLKTRGSDGTPGSHPAQNFYSKFDSKYFYMLGTTYFLNVYFRF